MSTLPNFPWTSRSHAQADASQSAPSPTAEPVEAVAPEPMASSPQAPAAPTYVTRVMGGEGRVTSSPKPSVIRARERERIKAIVLSPNAATNPVAALELAPSCNGGYRHPQRDGGGVLVVIGSAKRLEPPHGERGRACRRRRCSVVEGNRERSEGCRVLHRSHGTRPSWRAGGLIHADSARK